MNFFDAQDYARRSTRWLVGAYFLSTALIVAGVTMIVAVAFFQEGAPLNVTALATTAILTAALILGASLYKTAALSGGGGKVAQDMGGTLVPTDVTDPLRRRLRNVVEEMAIASGVPVPDIYVLEGESGINAFAAGFSPGDAAIAVTRGTLELLDREELQGVIAHEFSHILNGDMRLNIRLMGVLFGIMVIGLIGRMVLRSGYHGSLISSRRSKNAPVVMIIGFGLAILGAIGVFCARLIKAAVSRQREFLADASAVQFTRQTDGIANALKKIGGYAQHSYIEAADPEEVSHMLFAGGLRRMAGLFATHPPLHERIKALDPSFSPDDYPEVRPTGAPAEEILRQQAAGFAPTVGRLTEDGDVSIDRDIIESIGRPSPEQVGFARDLRRSIPESLKNAAYSADGAWLLTLALVMDPAYSERQLGILESQLGKERADRVRDLYKEIQGLGASYRLPLLEIAFPALKQRPSANLQYLLDMVRRLIETDGEIDLREYCYYRIIARHLEQAIDPGTSHHHNRVSKAAARHAAIDLLRIVADHGHDDQEAREGAFLAGVAVFGDWVQSRRVKDSGPQSVETLDQALDVLEKINMAGRRSMVEAVTRAISHDGRLTVTEAELLRAVCASLDCPLPPIISNA